MARRLVGVALLIEAALTASWLAGKVTTMVVHPAAVLAVIALRALVMVVQFAAGLMLLDARPPALLFARAALIASAALLVLELGVGLSPTSVFPSDRWPIVAAYAVYAGLAVVWLEAGRRCSDRGGR